MKPIEKMVQDLDQEINRLWEEYVALHEEFNQYRGLVVDDHYDEITRLINAIQDKFGELHHAYHFIAGKQQHVFNATDGYNEFIETLIKAGGKTVDPKAKSESNLIYPV